MLTISCIVGSVLLKYTELSCFSELKYCSTIFEAIALLDKVCYFAVDAFWYTVCHTGCLKCQQN